MDWLKKMFSHNKPNPCLFSEGVSSKDEKRRRIALLSDDEQKAFEWFRHGYTARWTAETMLLDRKTAKQLFGSLFRKLGVANEAEVCKLYRLALLQPKDVSLNEDDL